ncbi:MFS transporter [Sphingomonas sp. SUN039]|uniref:MFS transporter n=1 Tax=Sphingomonas sp. SUN039 TaxID=2937787 RepID=UPI002164E734|nr:MFS transporter [Sphingomonas sp. SUN039]UVO53113.1 MFS transporter [Sphingomonas sp. SUN039]
MEKVAAFWRDLTLKPQGFTIVVAAFLPIIAIVAMGPAVPTMIEHFANDPDARGKVPAMIGAPGLAMAILAPFAGMMVDRFGRRPILLVSTLFYAIFGAAPLLLDSLDQIYASRLLLGVAEAGILTVVNTLIGDYWEDRARKNWLFLQGLLGPFIAAIFSLIVGYASKAQWNGVFYVYLVALPIFVAMLLFLFEPKREVAPLAQVAAPPATAFPWASALQVAAVTLFASMLYYVFIINGALVFKEVGVTEPVRYAALIFVPSLFILAGAAIFRLLAMRANLLQLGVFMLLLGAGLTGMGLATTVPVMIACLIVQQTAAGMTVPTLIGWTQGKFGFAHRGRAMGIWTGAFFLGQSQSPRLVHALDASQGSMQNAFLTIGLVGLAGATVALALLASGRKSA